MTFSDFFGIIIQIMFKGRLAGVSDYEMLLAAQHSDCAFFSTVHKRKRIKASINMYTDKIYVFIGAFSV